MRASLILLCACLLLTGTLGQNGGGGGNGGGDSGNSGGNSGGNSRFSGNPQDIKSNAQVIAGVTDSRSGQEAAMRVGDGYRTFGNNHDSFGMTLGDSASTAAGFGRQGLYGAVQSYYQATMLGGNSDAAYSWMLTNAFTRRSTVTVQLRVIIIINLAISSQGCTPGIRNSLVTAQANAQASGGGAAFASATASASAGGVGSCLRGDDTQAKAQASAFAKSYGGGGFNLNMPFSDPSNSQGGTILSDPSQLGLTGSGGRKML